MKLQNSDGSNPNMAKHLTCLNTDFCPTKQNFQPIFKVKPLKKLKIQAYPRKHRQSRTR